MGQSENDGFVRQLFFGRFPAAQLLPWPEVGAEERENMEGILDALRRLAAESIDPVRHERDHRIPEETIQALRELGAFGLVIPEAMGGVGLSATSYCRFMEELSRFDASTSVTVGAHQSIGLKALLLAGTEEQKREWLPRLATGEVLAAFALTEPEAGSDAASLKTSCRPVPGEDAYVLNGTKQWITNGALAGFFTVFARHDDLPGEDHERISAFIVSSDMPGLSLGKEENKLGLKGSSTCQVLLENVKVPVKNLIGEKGKGFRLAVEVLNSGRTSLGAGCVGGCKEMLGLAAEFSAQRRQFGRPIAEFEMIRSKLARMAAATYALESAVFLTTSAIDRGSKDYSLEGAACKVFGTETLWSVLNDALQIAGGNGFMEEYPYSRGLRDSRINMIFEGTNEILRLYIALTGVKGPGKELAALGAAAKNPARWPGLLLGTLKDGLRAEESFPGLPAPLEEEGNRLALSSAALGAAVRRLLRTHRKGIVERQYQLERLADSAIDIYVASAALARAADAGRKGTATAASEQDSARLFAREAIGRIDRNLSAIDTNDDELRTRVSDAVRAAGGYPSPLW